MFTFALIPSFLHTRLNCASVWIARACRIECVRYHILCVWGKGSLSEERDILMKEKEMVVKSGVELMDSG